MLTRGSGDSQLAYPDMQRDPVVMRAGSMLLIRDAVRQMDTIGSSGAVYDESVRSSD